MQFQGHRSGPSVNQSAKIGRHRHVLNTKPNNSKAPKSSSLHLPVCLSQEIKILTNAKYLLNTFKVNEAEKRSIFVIGCKKKLPTEKTRGGFQKNK